MVVHHYADGHDYFFKVVLSGDSGVGKTNLLSRLCKNKFSPNSKPTIGVEFSNHCINVDDKIIKAQIWETNGQERNPAKIEAYYRDIQGALIVYDITRNVTFKNVESWLNLIRRQTNDQNIVIMLVGTKVDHYHVRAVKTEDAKAFAERENLLFFEISALESLNVDNAFTQLLTNIYHVKSKNALNIKNCPMKVPKSQTIVVGGENIGITRIPRLYLKETDFGMASASYSQQINGSIIEPMKFCNDNFSIWKNRMIVFLNFVDSELMDIMKKGRNIEDKQKVALDYKAKHILSVSLPDDIYRFVMYCESAKEMWDRLIVLFEGSDETRECRRFLLKQQYELFTCKPGESLTETYIRFNNLINDLRQHCETLNNDEIVMKFLRSLPVSWNTVSIMIRQTKNLKTMSLESLYGHLLTHEMETKNDAWMKEKVAEKTKIVIKPST